MLFFIRAALVVVCLYSNRPLTKTHEMITSWKTHAWLIAALMKVSYYRCLIVFAE